MGIFCDVLLYPFFNSYNDIKALPFRLLRILLHSFIRVVSYIMYLPSVVFTTVIK